MESLESDKSSSLIKENPSYREKNSSFIVKYRFLIGLFIRFIIVFVTDYLEYNGLLNYQDIDYLVFTDGARHSLNFESPYKRETFRYSPLMAYIMIPNLIISRAFGKYLFCICDVSIGILIELVLFKQNDGLNSYLYTVNKSSSNLNSNNFTKENVIDIISQSKYSKESMFHIFNPLAIAICTRGSSDSLTVFFILIIIYSIEYNKVILSGIFFGFIVHFRLYPVIYSGALFFYITFLTNKEQIKLKESTEKSNESMEKNFINRIKFMLKKCNFFIKFILNNLTCKNSIIFTFISILTFCSLNLFFYLIYKEEFLNEALLYHFIRKDHRHNFSIYNYLIYLTYNSYLAKIVSLISFLPQFLLIGLITLSYSSNINQNLILLTYIFVHFNKVITAQYFIWYFSLFPLINNNNLFKERKNILLGILWLVFELLWNFYANKLEYKGINVFTEMFIVEILFFLINVIIIGHIIKGENKKLN